GHAVERLALIIRFFALGCIITLLPLGILCDRFGRNNILMFVFSVGIICVILAGMLYASVNTLFILFMLSGMFIGSIFSLGIAYMTDLLPNTLLPAGNIMISVWFSVGSIIGPLLSGTFIDLFPNISFFYLVVAMLGIVLLLM